MKILHVTASAIRGGCEKNSYLFARHNNGQEHVVLNLGEDGPMIREWKDVGCQVITISLIDKNLFSFCQSLIQVVKTLRYDAVIVWTGGRLPYILKALEKPGIRIAIYVGNPLVLGKLSYLQWYLVGMLLKNKSNMCFFSCSVHVNDSLKYLPGSLRNIQRMVAYNPVPLLSHNPYSPDTDLDFNIGMVARLDPIKDHRTLINGFALFLKDHSSVKLNIVGGGVLQKELEGFAYSLGVSDKIVFHGDQANVYDHLQRWQLFVYSTTDQEGLGSVVIEAMANGLPLLLSDIKVLHEITGEDSKAHWFKAGDAAHLSGQLRQLFMYRNERESLSAKSFERAKYFSAANFSDSYFKFFNS